jgi:hypothetical protein
MTFPAARPSGRAAPSPCRVHQHTRRGVSSAWVSRDRQAVMLSRVVALLLLISPSVSLAQAVAPRRTAKPCRAQPALVGKCFRVYGRLALYNGAPTIRLWRAGTRRVLGVSGSYARDGYSSIPEELEQQLSWETELWGEYLVCPYTRRRAGEMQLVCIEDGKRINARPRR